MQLTFNKRADSPDGSPLNSGNSLADLRCGQAAVIELLNVPEDLGRRLMELGFFPGSEVVAAGCAPGGDPRVYRVDGAEIALRKETASLLKIQAGSIRTENPAKSPSSLL